MAVLKELACKVFDLEEDQVQVWDYHNCQIYGKEALDADEACLQETLQGKHILEGQEILVIEKVILSHSIQQARPTQVRPQIGFRIMRPQSSRGD